MRQRNRELQEIIAILGFDELSEDDRRRVSRARRLDALSESADVRETVRAAREILEGEWDHVPEEEAVEKATAVAV